jgi:hypothetical protein
MSTYQAWKGRTLFRPIPLAQAVDEGAFLTEADGVLRLSTPEDATNGRVDAIAYIAQASGALALAVTVRIREQPDDWRPSHGYVEIEPGFFFDGHVQA